MRPTVPAFALALTSFGLTACAPAPPPPLPPPQAARGEHAVAITLPPQAAPLKAKLQASSRAQVQEGGWVELRVYANERQCTFDQITRVPPMGPGFSVTLNCEAEVPASAPATFRAEQVGKDAVTSEVVLEATYVR